MSPPDQALDGLLRRTASVILAAGSSSRLGKPKQLIKWNGATLLARTVETVQALGAAQTVVIVGEHCPQVCRELSDFDVITVVNPESSRGLSSSLQLGLRAARAVAPALAAVIFTLCDQPYLHTPLLRDLMRGLALGYPIAASRYASLLGVPAAFAQSVFGELEMIRGDEGARSLLRGNAERVFAVPFDAGEVDIDYPEDLALHPASGCR